MDILTITGIIMGYLCLSLIITLPTHYAMIALNADKYEYKWLYVNLWKFVWDLEIFNNINKFGKIIIEVLYTIIFLPIILASNIFWLIGVILYFIIIKPFIFIFGIKLHKRIFDEKMIPSHCMEQYEKYEQQLKEKDEEIESLNERWSELWQIYSRLGVEAFGEDIQEQALKEIIKLQKKDNTKKLKKQLKTNTKQVCEKFRQSIMECDFVIKDGFYYIKQIELNDKVDQIEKGEKYENKTERTN